IGIIHSFKVLISSITTSTRSEVCSLLLPLANGLRNGITTSGVQAPCMFRPQTHGPRVALAQWPFSRIAIRLTLLTGTQSPVIIVISLSWVIHSKRITTRWNDFWQNPERATSLFEMFWIAERTSAVRFCAQKWPDAHRRAA